jgi:hypothetical protein
MIFFMPLPPLNNTAAWAAFIANPNWTGVTPEQVTDALNGIRACNPRRKKEEDFLIGVLEKRFDKQTKYGLGGCDADTRQRVAETAKDKLVEGALKPKSSINRGLRTVFNATVEGRRIDAQRHWTRRKANQPEIDYAGELPDVVDPTTVDEAEYNVFRQQVRAKLSCPEHQAAFDELAYDIPQSADIPERTRTRYRAEVRDIVKGYMTEGFMTADFMQEDPTELSFTVPLPLIGPQTSKEEICLIGFSLDCPKPTDADVARWCGFFPQYADSIRRCAKFMRLDVAQVLALELADA